MLPGTLEAWEEAALYARVSGYLSSVAVDLGDEVPEGRELARVVTPENRASLRRAHARVAEAEAGLRQVSAAFDLSELTNERLQALRLRDPAAVSEQQVDVAAAEARVARAKVSVATAAVNVARAERERMRTLDGFGVIRAPFAGRITHRGLHPGALVQDGTSPAAEPIVRIARLDPLRVVFEVPEPLVPQVEVGTPVELRLGIARDREIPAKIARFAGVLDLATRSMRAEVDLPNGEGRLQPGLYVGVHLSVSRLVGALTLPSNAVRGVGDERHILIARDGVLHRQDVVLASDDGRRAVLLRGVDERDQVVIAGSPLVRAGSKVLATERGL